MSNLAWRKFAISKNGTVWRGRCLWPLCGFRTVSDVSEVQFNVQMLEHMAEHTHKKRGYGAKDRYEKQP